MLLIWLLVWLVRGFPALHEWNTWSVSLIVCTIISILARGSSNRRS